MFLRAIKLIFPLSDQTGGRSYSEKVAGTFLCSDIIGIGFQSSGNIGIVFPSRNNFNLVGVPKLNAYDEGLLARKPRIKAK